MTLIGFEHLNLEDSFLLGVIADGDDLVLKVEFALSRDHPLYCEPLLGEARSWRVGEVRIQAIEVLSQERGGPFLGSDPDGGNIDLGPIGIYEDDGSYIFELSMGRFTCRASSVAATL